MKWSSRSQCDVFIDALQVVEGDDVRIGFETSLSPILIQGTNLNADEDFPTYYHAS